MANVGRPKIFKSKEELEEKIGNYFEEGAYIEMGDSRMYAPTMSGLALFLDIDRKTLLNYSKDEEFFPTIKRARAKVEEALEQRLYGQSVTGVIFNLKNNFGWADKQEIQQSVTTRVMPVPTADSVEDWEESSKETHEKNMG